MFYTEFIDWMNDKDLVKLWASRFIDQGTYDILRERRHVVKNYFTATVITSFILGVVVGHYLW